MVRDQHAPIVTCRQIAQWEADHPVQNGTSGLIDMSNGTTPHEAEYGAVQPVQPVRKPAVPLSIQVMPETPPAEWTPPENLSPRLSPRPNIAPVPDRLCMFLPPINFGAVEDYVIYRSGYPKPENFDFLAKLELKTILTLVPEPLSEDYLAAMHANGTRHVQIHIPANKDGNIAITQERMCMALSVVLDRKNHPILIHCNRGKHRTGCVTACFRKVQSPNCDDAAISEYRDYSYPKCRDGDMEFIRSFDPRSLYSYAQSHGWAVTPPPEPSNEGWHLQTDPLMFTLADIAALKLPEEPDSSL